MNDAAGRLSLYAAKGGVMLVHRTKSYFFICLRRLACVALLLATGALGGVGGAGPAVAQNRPTPQTLTQPDLANYRVQDLVVLARNASSDGLCQNFETILSELYFRAYGGFVTLEKRNDAEAAQQAFENLRPLRCPPPPKTTNRQASPTGGEPPRRVLTGEELQRVLPHVAIARGHIFTDTNVGRRAQAARQKMRDGIARGDRTLYDEGVAALIALKDELRLAFDTLISTPLDPSVETRESKTARAGRLLADAGAIDAMRRAHVFPVQKSLTAPTKPKKTLTAKPHRKKKRPRVRSRRDLSKEFPSESTE